MFKFLRKYNKIILVVGGVLLMITFLIPEAIQRLGQSAGQSGASFASVGDGESVSAVTLDNLRRELQIMDRMQVQVPGLGKITRPEHWYLLTREAEAAGLIAPGRAVPLDNATLAAALPSQRDFDFIRQTLAKANGVAQLVNLYQTGELHSDRRLKNFAARTMHSVNTQMVVLEADKEQSEVNPSEEELLAQFEKWKDTEPGEGDHGFGYKLPNRVKVEWIKVAEPAVREMVRQGEDFDRVAQRYHWKSNPDQSFQVYSDTGEVPAEVSNDLLDKLTARKMDEISKFAADQLRLARRGLPEKDGRVVLPVDWDQKRLKLQDLASQLQQRFGIQLPEYQAIGDRWLTLAELNDIPGLGQASTTKFGERATSFPFLVGEAAEFDGSASYQIQKGIAGPPVKDGSGNLYLFRITDADASRSPTSLDEVREAVMTDVRRLDHFKALVEQAAALEQQAETEGLLGIAMAHDTVVQPQSPVYLNNPFFLQMQMQNRLDLSENIAGLPVIGTSKSATEAIVDYARSLPAGELTEAQRIIAVPVEEKLALLIVRITEQHPLTEETFNNLARMNAVQQLLSNSELGDTEELKDVFGYDAMAKRHNFKLDREAEPADDQTPATADASNKA